MKYFDIDGNEVALPEMVQTLHEKIEVLEDHIRSQRMLLEEREADLAAFRWNEQCETDHGDEESEYEKTFREFWMPILTRGGKLDLELVKKELYNYHVIMNNVSTVYMHITGNRISKPNTLANEIIAEHDDLVNELVEERLNELLESQSTSEIERYKDLLQRSELAKEMTGMEAIRYIDTGELPDRLKRIERGDY